jgi:single-stranded-DNA-specific exonuclease
MVQKDGKIWEVKTPDEDIIYRISRNFGVSRLAARILANRNFHEQDEIRAFLSPDLNALSDPMDMVDIDKAASRVIDACTKDERPACTCF